MFAVDCAGVSGNASVNTHSLNNTCNAVMMALLVVFSRFFSIERRTFKSG